MCGIVGYIGNRQSSDILLRGLERLEYRGYDSAGLAVFDAKTKSSARWVNCKVEALKKHRSGVLGIGHTRWAAHGRPSEENAHPHTAGPVTVVQWHCGKSLGAACGIGVVVTYFPVKPIRKFLSRHSRTA